MWGVLVLHGASGAVVAHATTAPDFGLPPGVAGGADDASALVPCKTCGIGHLEPLAMGPMLSAFTLFVGAGGSSGGAGPIAVRLRVEDRAMLIARLALSAGGAGSDGAGAHDVVVRAAAH